LFGHLSPKERYRMNIIFFGTSKFAVPSLVAIAKSRHKILAVVTRPDKAGGRGMHMLQSPVKMTAKDLGLEIHQPADVSSEGIAKILMAKRGDFFVVISYGQILKKQILDIPKRYCVNLHASLLPKYRGAAPCNWAVINSEKKTGVTIIRLNERMDAGDIIASQSINISGDDTSQDIYNQLALVGAETLLATLSLIESKKERFIPQDEKFATYAPKLKKQDGLIDWKKPAEEIRNLIRGTQPWPGAYTYLDNKLLKIYKAETVGGFSAVTPGEIVKIDKDSFIIACGKDALIIVELQLEGKRCMSAEEFLRGVHLKKGQMLS